MRVGGALLVAVSQAALQHSPAGRIERDRVWPIAQPESLGLVVDVIDLQQPSFLAGGPVQESEYPDNRLVRVDIGICGPAAEQRALLVEGEGAAAEAVGLLGGQARGGVDQHQTLGAGESEELPQHGRPPFAGLGWVNEERLDVVDVDQGPLVFAPVRDQEAGEIAQDGQPGFDGVVAAGSGSRPAGAFRARSIESAKLATAGRNGSGTSLTRRCRRPAANWSAWLVGRAKRRLVKKSSNARASGPMERPGMRARSSSAAGS
ncbi:hypothetical protein [Actinophytocola sp.]|jgi:hypothetical protein|uniref:hypothetical protein n=1 Tax=Actinophytocola sp. TaxID=1872138 RepID=UPI002ED7AABC